MTSQLNNKFSIEDILNDLFESLEISTRIQKKLEDRYENLGTWLK